MSVSDSMRGKFKAENDALGVVTSTSGGDKTFVQRVCQSEIHEGDRFRRSGRKGGSVRGWRRGHTVLFPKPIRKWLRLATRSFHVDGQSGTGFAVNAGAGIDIRLTDRVHLFAEAPVRGRIYVRRAWRHPAFPRSSGVVLRVTTDESIPCAWTTFSALWSWASCGN